MRTRTARLLSIGARVVLMLVLAVPVGVLAPPVARVTAQIMGDLPTTRHFHFDPTVVTNRHRVTMSYANTTAGPVTVSMEILGSRVTGTSWDPGALLAAQKPTVLAPGQGITIDGHEFLGLGERGQVYGRLTVTGIFTSGEPVASLEIADLLGVVPPQIIAAMPHVGGEPPAQAITQAFHFDPAPVTNRHVVRISYANTNAVPVRVTMEILGGRVTNNTWNAGGVLAARRDLLLGPGQATVLTLDWNAAGGLADGQRAQVYGRLTVTGIVITGGCPVASLQISDLLGLLPTRMIEHKDG